MHLSVNYHHYGFIVSVSLILRIIESNHLTDYYTGLSGINDPITKFNNFHMNKQKITNVPF